MQENIAEEMIKMAQNLKHSSVVARNIIKEDNKVRSVLFSETLHRSAMGAKWGTEGTEKRNQTLSTRGWIGFVHVCFFHQLSTLAFALIANT